MQELLLSLYPKAWLEQYGDEYAALLEGMDLSPAAVADIVKSACLMQLEVHKRALIAFAGATFSFVSSVVCMHQNLTANLWIWAPSTPRRALGLIITLGPLLYAAYFWLRSFDAALKKQKWYMRAATYLFLIVPSGLLSLLCLALVYSFFGVGDYGAGRPVYILLAQSPLLILCLFAIKMSGAVRGRILRQISA